MSKKRKKRSIGMTEGAKNAMNDYGKQVFDNLDRNFRDSNDPHNITLQSVSTHFAKEGFKKGYDYGKREERAKEFNIYERIQDFRDEMRPICKSTASTSWTPTSIWSTTVASSSSKRSSAVHYTI